MLRAKLDQGLFQFAAPLHRRGRRRTKSSLVAHGSRPELKKGDVVHVTIKLKGGLPSLRQGKALDVVLAAIERVNRKRLIRIVEFSVQSNHVHLLVEASKSADLSSGMASLNTGLGMRLNRVWNRIGQGGVLRERFHMVIIRTPRQMRNALRYVLRNDVHHGLMLGVLDPCSSAPSFGGWAQLQGSKAQRAAATSCVSAAPRTWLLKVGWQKANGQCQLLSTSGLPSLAIEA